MGNTFTPPPPPHTHTHKILIKYRKEKNGNHHSLSHFSFGDGFLSRGCLQQLYWKNMTYWVLHVNYVDSLLNDGVKATIRLLKSQIKESATFQSFMHNISLTPAFRWPLRFDAFSSQIRADERLSPAISRTEVRRSEQALHGAVKRLQRRRSSI